MYDTMQKQFVFLIAILSISLSTSMFACSCIRERSVKEEIKYSDAVVVGTIVSMQVLTIPDPDSDENLPSLSKYYETSIARYELIVSEIYKGSLKTDTLIIYTGMGNGDCGIEFEIGKKYIVYGTLESSFGVENAQMPKSENAVWAHICSRTMRCRVKEINEIKKYLSKRKIKKA